MFIPRSSRGHVNLSECLPAYLHQLWEVRLEKPASIPEKIAEAPLEESEGDTSNQAGTLGATLGHHPRKQEALPNIGIQSLEAKISLLSLSPAQLSLAQPSPVTPGSAAPGTTAQLPRPGLADGVPCHLWLVWGNSQ